MSVIDYQSPELRNVLMIHGIGINIRRNGSELLLNGLMKAIYLEGPERYATTLYRTNKVVRELNTLNPIKTLRLQANTQMDSGSVLIAAGNNHLIVSGQYNYPSSFFSLDANSGSDPQLPTQTMTFQGTTEYGGTCTRNTAVAYDGKHYWVTGCNNWDKMTCASVVGPSDSPTLAPTPAPTGSSNPTGSGICNIQMDSAQGLDRGVAYANSEIWMSASWNSLDTFVRYNVNTGQKLPDFQVNSTSLDSYRNGFTLSKDGKTLYLVSGVSESNPFRYVNVLSISTETGLETNLFKLRVPDIGSNDYWNVFGTVMTSQGLVICILPDSQRDKSTKILTVAVYPL